MTQRGRSCLICQLKLPPIPPRKSNLLRPLHQRRREDLNFKRKAEQTIVFSKKAVLVSRDHRMFGVYSSWFVNECRTVAGNKSLARWELSYTAGYFAERDPEAFEWPILSSLPGSSWATFMGASFDRKCLVLPWRQNWVTLNINAFMGSMRWSFHYSLSPPLRETKTSTLHCNCTMPSCWVTKLLGWVAKATDINKIINPIT